MPIERANVHRMTRERIVRVVLKNEGQAVRRQHAMEFAQQTEMFFMGDGWNTQAANAISKLASGSGIFAPSKRRN